MGTLSGFGTGKPSTSFVNVLPELPRYEVSMDTGRLKGERKESLRAFKAAAYAGVKWVAKHKDQFTTDDVWDYLKDFASDVVPEPRVLGEVMRHAQKEGIIFSPPIPIAVKSRRKINHGRPVKVWVSRIYVPTSVEEG